MNYYFKSANDNLFRRGWARSVKNPKKNVFDFACRRNNTLHLFTLAFLFLIMKPCSRRFLWGFTIKSYFKIVRLQKSLILCSLANFLSFLHGFRRIFSFTCLLTFSIRTDLFLLVFFCISIVPRSLNCLLVRSINLRPTPIFCSFRKISIFLKLRLCKFRTSWRFASIAIATQIRTVYKCADHSV